MRALAGGVVLVLLAVAGCEDGGGSQAGEDALSLPCGRPCGAHEVCSMRVCVPSFIPATYAITIDLGHFPPTHGGSPWDPDGPPDLYATVTLGATVLGSGGVIADDVDPSWNATLPTTVALTRDDHLRIEVFDEDGATDALAFSCTQAVTTILGRTGETLHYGCIMEPSQASGWVGFSLTPQP
jgi:hypothetical protein